MRPLNYEGGDRFEAGKDPKGEEVDGRGGKEREFRRLVFKVRTEFPEI